MKVRSLRRTEGFLLSLVLCLFPALLQAQEPPEFLRARALVVRFLVISGDSPSENAGSASNGANGAAAKSGAGQASATGALQGQAWSARSQRYTVSGSPVGIRLASDKLVVIVQVTPYDHGKEGLAIVAQGQVWSRQENGEIAYRNVFETLAIAYGEKVFFYPFGIKADGTASMRLEIAVDHFGDPPSIPEDGPDAQSRQAQGAKGQVPVPPELALPAKRGQ